MTDKPSERQSVEMIVSDSWEDRRDFRERIRIDRERRIVDDRMKRRREQMREQMFGKEETIEDFGIEGLLGMARTPLGRAKIIMRSYWNSEFNLIDEDRDKYCDEAIEEFENAGMLKDAMALAKSGTVSKYNKSIERTRPKIERRYSDSFPIKKYEKVELVTTVEEIEKALGRPIDGFDKYLEIVMKNYELDNPERDFHPTREIVQFLYEVGLPEKAEQCRKDTIEYRLKHGGSLVWNHEQRSKKMVAADYAMELSYTYDQRDEARVMFREAMDEAVSESNWSSAAYCAERANLIDEAIEYSIKENYFSGAVIKAERNGKESVELYKRAFEHEILDESSDYHRLPKLAELAEKAEMFEESREVYLKAMDHYEASGLWHEARKIATKLNLPEVAENYKRLEKFTR